MKQIKVGDRMKIKLDHMYHPNKQVIVTLIGEGECSDIAMVMDVENENVRWAVKIKDLI